MSLEPITFTDLIAALERIEMLTATGMGLDPDTTMHIHLLAGIGRAFQDHCIAVMDRIDARQEVMF